MIAIEKSLGDIVSIVSQAGASAVVSGRLISGATSSSSSSSSIITGNAPSRDGMVCVAVLFQVKLR